MRTIIITLLLTFCFIQVRAQALLSGFSLKEKEKVVALGYGADVAQDYFIKSRTLNLPRTIDIIGFYGALGLKNNWNAVFTYALIDFKPQDFRIGLSKQYANIKNWYAVAGGGIYGPSFNYKTEGLNAKGQQAKGLWIENVIQWRKNSSHIDFALTANLNYDIPPPSFQASLAYGLSSKYIYLKMFGTYQHSTGNKFYRGTGNEAPETFKELAVSYFKAGGQIILTKWAWQPYLGLAQIFWGQNVFKATAYSAGVIKRF